MSEKRFVCIDIGYGDGWYITDNGERLSEMEIVDLLNEQQAIIHRDEISINTMMSNMKKLEEENEELKEIHQKGSKSCEKWKQHKEAQIQQLEKMNEDLREVNKENKLLHEENVKQCEKWKNLYELKDSEVTARVDSLNRVCNYYLTEVQFIADTDPNEAVKEVINEILNAPIYEE